MLRQDLKANRCLFRPFFDQAQPSMCLRHIKKIALSAKGITGQHMVPATICIDEAEMIPEDVYELRM